MKKSVYILLILIVLALSACSGQAPLAHRVTNSSADQLVSLHTSSSGSALSLLAGDGISTNFDNAESVLTQMILGIIKLDGTNLALTKDQATSMLALWDAYQTELQSSMPSGGKPGDGNQPSGTPAARPTMDPNATPAAPAVNTKLDTLASSMVAVLTADQIQAINEMKITRDIATTIMQEKGIANGDQNGQNSQSNSQPNGNGQQQPPAGGQQPPANGQQPQQPPSGNQGNTPGSGQSGQIPAGGPGGRGGMVQQGLMKAFTTLLEKVSGSTSTVAFTPAGFTPAGQFSQGPLPGDNLPGGIGQPGQGGPGSSSINVTYAAVYQQDGGAKTKANQTINAIEKDQSAVLVANSGTLSLSKSKIATSGNTSSQDSSSFVGLNAAILATTGSNINLSDSTITTTGEGANGAFATGSGSTVYLTNVVINAAAGGGHGVMATNGGTVALKDVDIMTAGKNSGALATDRGSGTIIAEGGTVTTSGADSPAIYSTGTITVNNGKYSASGAESAVIEGGNSITLNNSTLTSSFENKWGIMIYQSMSGDAEGTRGTFSMSGGELSMTASTGPLFYVTNSTGVINLTGVAISVNSGELIQAAAGRWGSDGSNGGSVILTASGQNLAGKITADKLSSVDLILKDGSTLKSALNPTNSAKQINLTLDATSSWNVTANSYLTSINNPQGITGTEITNIKGNGFTVYYDSTACPELGGKTYTLLEGGTLTPVS